MVSFSLITDGQVGAFLAVVRKNGFAEADFELQEEGFDQQTAEVEARKGDVGVIPRLDDENSSRSTADPGRLGAC